MSCLQSLNEHFELLVLGGWDFHGFGMTCVQLMTIFIFGLTMPSVKHLVASLTIFFLPLVLCSSVDEGSRNKQI